MTPVVVVTGATGGLGRAAATNLARTHRVLLVGRDAARGAEALAAARAVGEAELVLGDVSTRAGIRAVAAAIRAATPRVDVLLNNAGGTFPEDRRTEDGLEATFALNTFGPFLLEKELHDLVRGGRVVNVATGFLDRYPVDVDDLPRPKRFAGVTQYARAKNALVMATVELAARYAADGTRVVSVHPGIVMGTGFGGGQPAWVQAVAGPLMRAIGLACTMEEAMRRFEVAATADVPSGSYLVKGEVAPLPKPARDPEVRARVLALLDGLA